MSGIEDKRVLSGTFQPDEAIPEEPHRILHDSRTYLVSDIVNHSTDEAGIEEWTVNAVPVPPAKQFTIRVDHVQRTWQIEVTL